MLQLVFAKGDARPERQSSWPTSASAARSVWPVRFTNYARFAFAGFVLLHLSGQAYRAFGDGVLPEPGLELEPWFVAAVLLLVWLPFAVVSGRELGRARPALPKQAEQRALAIVEPVALVIVLSFALVHGAGVAWPLLSGSLTSADVRPGLVADLSSTRHGVPLQASATLIAVGAASFYAVRQALAALPNVRPPLARGVVTLGVLAYLLGSYAVIRCASGTILP